MMLSLNYHLRKKKKKSLNYQNSKRHPIVTTANPNRLAYPNPTKTFR